METHVLQQLQNNFLFAATFLLLSLLLFFYLFLEKLICCGYVTNNLCVSIKIYGSIWHCYPRYHRHQYVNFIENFQLSFRNRKRSFITRIFQYFSNALLFIFLICVCAFLCFLFGLCWQIRYSLCES